MPWTQPHTGRRGAAAVTIASLAALASASSQVAFYSAPPPPAGISQDSQEAGLVSGENVATDDSNPVAGIFARKPFRITVSLREGYDDNVLSSNSDRIGSFYTNMGASIDYSFGSPRLQLSTNLAGGVTWYYNNPEDDVQFNIVWGLSAQYLATDRLTLSFSTSTAYLPQQDLSIVGGSNQNEGAYFYTNTSIAAAFRWSEKISTITGYNFSAIYYTDQDYNNQQGNINQTLSQSILWLWRPKTTLVLEYRANAVTYYDSDLDSFGNFLLTGFDHIFNPRFRWSARLGVEQRFNNNPVDGSSIYVGPYMESTLTYQFGRASNLAWTMRYGTEASGIEDVTQSQTFRTGLILSHAFTGRISASIAGNYLLSYYNQDNVIDTYYENSLSFSANVNFVVNRYASLSAGYQFITVIAPSGSTEEYTRNIVFAGVNFAF